MEADEGGVARVLGIHGHGGIGHDCFRAGGGDLEKGSGFFHNLDAVVVEKGFLGFRDDFLVAERGERDGAPVHHALAAIDEALRVEINENLLHFARVGVVHREAFPGPIAGAAEFFELVDDDAAVLVLPLPDALEELVAAEVVAGFLFLLAEFAFDDGLRGDAGVVGAGEPEDFVAGLAGVAGEDVLECVVEHMAERENAGDIRRRDDDRVGGLRRGGVGGEVAVLDPPGIPLFFDGLGLVGLGQFRHGAGFNRVRPRRESGKCGRGSDSAEAAGATGVVLERGEEILPLEIGPEFFGHMDFRVAELPEEKIRNAHLAGGADEEVGVGHPGCVQAGANEFGRDVGFAHGACGSVADEGFHGINNLGAAAVAQGEDEVELGVRRGGFHHLAELALADGGEFLDAADVVESDALADHFIALLVEEIFQQKHEGVDLEGGAFPVLRGKGVERQILNAGVEAGLDAALDGFRARLVACDARETALLGPTAVAVHNNGDMLGDNGAHLFAQSRMVCSRPGPMLTIERLAPTSPAIFLT